MLKFLRHIVKGFRRHLTAIVLIGIAEVGLSLLFVWFSKIIIDIATGARTGILLQYAVFLILLIATQIMLRMLDVRLRNITEVRLGNTIRHTVFSHLLYARWEDLPTLHSGDVLTRIIRDTDDVVNVLVTAFPLTISALVQFIGAVVLLFVLDPVLAIILGVAMPLIALFGRVYYHKMRKYSHEVKKGESRITEWIEESLLNQLVIRTFEKQDDRLAKLKTLQNDLEQSVSKKTNVSVLANTLMSVAFNGGYIAAFLWSAYGLAKKTITFGTVTAYLQLVSRIQRPVFDLIRLLPGIIAAKAAYDRLHELMKFELENHEDKIFLPGALRLTIENLSYAYSSDYPAVLQNFSLDVAPGTMVAVVGKTGAGKTTLLRLLLGLLKPDKGSILVGNETQLLEVSEVTRPNFVYVPQRNLLFSGTIRDNLLIGNEKADDGMLREALMAASASFVFDFPDGLDAYLSENGSSLSEGQAQRIAIARSLLRPGKILLLDEATSALDIETEKNFLHHLKQGIGDRIVIFVTHHVEVVKCCDIVVRI
ncbi:MAG TPA: ABC transporter ATP-binding protein [Paludibacteraceae bacterium]|mgnify:FL=1|jgi:ABC-type bacteriocin/lantibiotic exporter with double-glycine peptidase domain|nr:ABC transporter ATP-binding protein [Dysgonamonadaceae bacterium]HOV35090.1 ABC transporter ATP-binding protein [Dysgonamonadaceae bacterium]HQF10960.1 ABC transporter ATP-binding protein [Paludibacteraceae bacterium]HQI43550.1 ABC transporter ATP-binding protein [Dysgonamonadaceae bacterium]